MQPCISNGSSVTSVHLSAIRRLEQSFESRTVDSTREETSLHNNVEANTNKDAPPSYSDVSQNSEGLPPSYPGA